MVPACGGNFVCETRGHVNHSTRLCVYWLQPLVHRIKEGIYFPHCQAEPLRRVLPLKVRRGHGWDFYMSTRVRSCILCDSNPAGPLISLMLCNEAMLRHKLCINQQTGDDLWFIHNLLCLYSHKAGLLCFRLFIPPFRWASHFGSQIFWPPFNMASFVAINII